MQRYQIDLRVVGLAVSSSPMMPDLATIASSRKKGTCPVITIFPTSETGFSPLEPARGAGDGRRSSKSSRQMAPIEEDEARILADRCVRPSGFRRASNWTPRHRICDGHPPMCAPNRAGPANVMSVEANAALFAGDRGQPRAATGPCRGVTLIQRCRDRPGRGGGDGVPSPVSEGYTLCVGSSLDGKGGLGVLPPARLPRVPALGSPVHGDLIRAHKPHVVLMDCGKRARGRDVPQAMEMFPPPLPGVLR